MSSRQQYRVKVRIEMSRVKRFSGAGIRPRLAVVTLFIVLGIFLFVWVTFDFDQVDRLEKKAEIMYEHLSKDADNLIIEERFIRPEEDQGTVNDSPGEGLRR